MSLSSTLLGAGLNNIFDGQVNQNPDNPADPALQAEYNRAAVQVGWRACAGGQWSWGGLVGGWGRR